MVHSVSGWTRGVQVNLWDPLRTPAIPERLRSVFTTRRYTNPRLPVPYLYRCLTVVKCSSLNWTILYGVELFNSDRVSGLSNAEHFSSILIPLRHCLQSAKQYRARDVEPVSKSAYAVLFGFIRVIITVCSCYDDRYSYLSSWYTCGMFRCFSVDSSIFGLITALGLIQLMSISAPVFQNGNN